MSGLLQRSQVQAWHMAPCSYSMKAECLRLVVGEATMWGTKKAKEMKRRESQRRATHKNAKSGDADGEGGLQRSCQIDRESRQGDEEKVTGARFGRRSFPWNQCASSARFG